MNRVLMIPLFALCACNPYGDMPTEGAELREAIARVNAEGDLWQESLEAFRQSHGRYPSGNEGLGVLVHRPDTAAFPEWSGPYGPAREALLRDPWQRRYHLDHSETRLTVRSNGPDQTANTGDDIRTSIELHCY